MDEKISLYDVMLKEMDLIQNIIDRLAKNSFLIKGWTITLVSVTLLLKGDATNFIIIATIPLLIFWILDSYYLYLECRYRELYDWVIQNRRNSDKYLFDLSINKRIKSQNTSKKLRVFLSKTLLIFYGSLLIIIFIYLIWINQSVLIDLLNI